MKKFIAVTIVLGFVSSSVFADSRARLPSESGITEAKTGQAHVLCVSGQTFSDAQNSLNARIRSSIIVKASPLPLDDAAGLALNNSDKSATRKIATDDAKPVNLLFRRYSVSSPAIVVNPKDESTRICVTLTEQ